MLRANGPNNSSQCWELLANNVGFVQTGLNVLLFQTLRNNMQQAVQTDETCNIQQCWELCWPTMWRSFARGLRVNNFNIYLDWIWLTAPTLYLLNGGQSVSTNPFPFTVYKSEE